MENSLRKFITSDFEYKHIIEEATALKEDIEFFKMYIKRNSKNSFCAIRLTINQHRFIEYLYNNYYSYSLHDLCIMITEYYAARRVLGDLKCTFGGLSDEEVCEIYRYFKETHSLDLLDYVNDFTGCSRVSDEISRKLGDIVCC